MTTDTIKEKLLKEIEETINFSRSHNNGLMAVGEAKKLFDKLIKYNEETSAQKDILKEWLDWLMTEDIRKGHETYSGKLNKIEEKIQELTNKLANCITIESANQSLLNQKKEILKIIKKEIKTWEGDIKGNPKEERYWGCIGCILKELEELTTKIKGDTANSVIGVGDENGK